jgi:outer membrane PBP1 activator LpoA protein
MEGQREKTSSRRRQRRKAKNARGKVVVEPVLIAARRPDSPLLKSGFRNVVASAHPKSSVASSASSNGHAHADAASEMAGIGIGSGRA